MRLSNRTTSPNPFISGNRANPFINRKQSEEQEKAQEKPQAEEQEQAPEKKEEFPSLVSTSLVSRIKPDPKTPAATSTKTSYKELLVTTIDHRMVEEQSKLRLAQAAELERSYKHYSNAAIADARTAAAAAAATAAASTDLELLYDEDGRERS